MPTRWPLRALSAAAALACAGGSGWPQEHYDSRNSGVAPSFPSWNASRGWCVSPPGAAVPVGVSFSSSGVTSVAGDALWLGGSDEALYCAPLPAGGVALRFDLRARFSAEGMGALPALAGATGVTVAPASAICADGVERLFVASTSGVLWALALPAAGGCAEPTPSWSVSFLQPLAAAPRVDDSGSFVLVSDTHASEDTQGTLRCLRTGDGSAVWSQAAVDPTTGASYGLHGVSPIVDPVGGLRDGAGAGAGEDRAIILAYAGRLLAADLLNGRTLHESKVTTPPWSHHFLGGVMTADGKSLFVVSVKPEGGLAGVGSGRLHRFELRLQRKVYNFGQKWMRDLVPLPPQVAGGEDATSGRGVSAGVNPTDAMYWGTASPVFTSTAPAADLIVVSQTSYANATVFRVKNLVSDSVVVWARNSWPNLTLAAARAAAAVGGGDGAVYVSGEAAGAGAPVLLVLAGADGALLAAVPLDAAAAGAPLLPTRPVLVGGSAGAGAAAVVVGTVDGPVVVTQATAAAPCPSADLAAACSGHGACVCRTGACACAAGWAGDDCSVPAPPAPAPPAAAAAGLSAGAGVALAAFALATVAAAAVAFVPALRARATALARRFLAAGGGGGGGSKFRSARAAASEARLAGLHYSALPASSRAYGSLQ